MIFDGKSLRELETELELVWEEYLQVTGDEPEQYLERWEIEKISDRVDTLCQLVAKAEVSC